MRVISRKKIKEAVARRGDLEVPLDVWFRIAKKAEWKNLADVRKTFSTADAVGKWTVFNIKGNRYRLITEINCCPANEHGAAAKFFQYRELGVI